MEYSLEALTEIRTYLRHGKSTKKLHHEGFEFNAETIYCAALLKAYINKHIYIYIHKHIKWFSLSVSQMQSGADGGRRLAVTFRADSKFMYYSIYLYNDFPGCSNTFLLYCPDGGTNPKNYMLASNSQH